MHIPYSYRLSFILIFAYFYILVISNEILDILKMDNENKKKRRHRVIMSKVSVAGRRVKIPKMDDKDNEASFHEDFD